jgi:hypothetical protein
VKVHSPQEYRKKHLLLRFLDKTRMEGRRDAKGQDSLANGISVVFMAEFAD